jgi:DNA-binding beta-propeller fold protein YncE
VTPLFLVCALLIGADHKETTLIPPPFWHDLGYHRASNFFLDMYLGHDFRFDDPEGLACERMIAEEQRSKPGEEDILSLFGVNSGTSQILYNLGMSKLALFGGAGSGDGQFQHPHGIAVDRQGDIYIADTDNNRVVRLRYLTTGLVFVRNYNGFTHPYGVALDSRRQVYVTEQNDAAPLLTAESLTAAPRDTSSPSAVSRQPSASSDVVVMDSLGNVLQRWAGLDSPTGIAVIDPGTTWNRSDADFAVVIDRDGQRLTKFSRFGERLASIEARDIGLAVAQFAYCALDYYADVYVTDEYNDQVHKFDRDLHYLTSYGRTGSGDGEFKSPRGIAIGRQFGQVFVAEAEGGQYLWVGLDAYMVGCFPPVISNDRPGTTIALYVTETADLTLGVYDHKNKLVRTIYANEIQEKPGEVLVVWDGRDNHNTLVGPGEYTIRATLRPTYGGQRQEIKKELTATVKRI